MIHDTWNRTNYANKNSRGQGRLKQRAKMTSMGIHFFLAVLMICAVLVGLR